ncbi:MAG: hypothetical protein WKF75_21050 [Singulisphaera sp.]
MSISEAFAGAGRITQMAWGPDGRLMLADRWRAVSLSTTRDGQFSDLQRASDISGVGIGFLRAAASIRPPPTARSGG